MERRLRRDDLETLQRTIDELDQVKVENQRLSTLLEAANGTSKQRVSERDANEEEDVKAQLERCKEDFQRAMRARSMLETRCRHYKEIQKEWRSYYHDWILRHPKMEHSATDGNLDKQVGSVVASVRRPESEPAPPSCPETTSALSDTSRPVSPRQKYVFKGMQACDDSRADPDRFAVTQMAVDGENGLGLSGPTVTTDDCERRPSDTHQEPSYNKNIKNNRASGSFDRSSVDNGSPVFISERSLKRKDPTRGSKKGVQIHEDNHVRPGNPAIKDERHSSSPVSQPLLLKSSTIAGDSLDLDDLGCSLNTPRKRQRLEQNKLGASKPAHVGQSAMRNLFSNDAVEENSERTSDASKPKDEGNASWLYENRGAPLIDSLPNDLHQKKVRKEAQIAQQNAHNERVHQRLVSKNVRSTLPQNSPDVENRTPVTIQKLREKKRQARLPNPVALQPTDPNALPRTANPSVSGKRDRPPGPRDRRIAFVSVLAEGGENQAPGKPGRDPAANSKKTEKVSDAHTRLGTLLNDPSPSKDSIIGFPAGQTKPSSGGSTRQPSFEVGSTTPRNLSPRSRFKASGQTASRSAQQLAAKRKPTSMNDQRSDIFPEDEPLRARPLHRLRLEDFKLNPDHSNYAYHETIRKHDEKKARNGCTDPFCKRCKDLKKFVEISGYNVPKKTGLFDCSPSEETEQTVDDCLLKEYLGGDVHKLRHMSEREKKDSLLKARTKQFQDEFGKHRQGMSRAFEPPGFWNTDFPSTQEDEQLKEEARTMERQKVEERWEEARRRGLWLFADEV